MSNQFIVEVIPKHFHLLPQVSTTQDLNMKSIKSGGLLHAKYLYQKDGSRFKVIYSKAFDQVDIIMRLKVLFPDRPDIWPETKVSKDRLMEHVGVAWLGKKDAYEYRAYQIHTFLNGKRFLPMLVNTAGRTFYNLSNLFPKLIPEDDFGVLCDEVEDLTIEDTWTPKEICYQSFIRLCPSCGIVSNISKPKMDPWMSKKHQ